MIFFMTSIVKGATLLLTQCLAWVFKIKGFYLAHSKYQGEDENGDIYFGSKPAQIGQETSFL